MSHQSTATAHADNPLFKPFIDRLNSEKLEFKYTEKGISCYVVGMDLQQKKCTTKIEIELIGENEIKAYHYINEGMQDRFKKGKQIGKNLFAESTPKTDQDLFEDFINTAQRIEIFASDANDVNYDRQS